MTSFKSLTKHLGLFGLLLALHAVPGVAQNSVQDADNDTRVETQRGGGDPDNIYFRTGGIDRLLLSGSTLSQLNNGSSVFLGQGAGANDDLSNNRNVFLGFEAGGANTTGQFNTAVGYKALEDNTTGELNIAIGAATLINNTTGNRNLGLGLNALFANTTGNDNAAIGGGSLGNLTTGSNNIAIGREAGLQNTGGSNNTYIGSRAGRGTAAYSGTGNVFIGYRAGETESGDNKLIIANSGTTTPLINGDFSTGNVRFNVRNSTLSEAFQVNSTTALPANTDLVSLQMAAGSSDDSQFIEFENGGVVASIDGDGTANFKQGNFSFDGSGTSATLHVEEAGPTDWARIQFDNTGGTDYWRIGARGNTTSDDDMRFFYNDGSNKNIMTIRSDGKFGLNTTAPAAQMHLLDEDSGIDEVLRLDGSAPFMTFYDGTDYLGYLYHTGTNGSLNLYNLESGNISLDGALNVTSGADIGIGTTNPLAKTHIIHNSLGSDPHVRLQETTSTDFARLEMRTGTGSDIWQFAGRSNQSSSSSDIMNFYYEAGGSGSNIMTLNGGTDRVGIGTTAPSRKLHVVGDGYFSTGVYLGSAEAFTDGGSFTIASNSDIDPTTNGSRDLGNSVEQWRNLYLTGSVLFAPPGGGTSARGSGKDFEYGLEEVLQLQPAAYDITAEDGSTTTKFSIAPQSMASAVSELYVAEEQVTVENENGETTSFVTKSLETPAVNTLDLIPVLVKAIQDQNQEVEELRQENAELQEQLDQLAAFGTASEELTTMLADIKSTKEELELLKADLAACCQSNTGVVNPIGGNTSFVSPNNLDMPSLEQNAPNPFSARTSIRYYMPRGSEGVLVITDAFGREIAREVAQEGANTLEIEAGQLVSGTYNYSLVVEGIVMTSKQMVITK